MELRTFDAVVQGMCDAFDELIAPKKMLRSNTNVVYLLLKAIAKGYEIINNVCVLLFNKFDPASCSEEDLESVAYLVGTERLAGSGSGLRILCTNNNPGTATLLQGTYYYNPDADTSFEFEVTEDTEIPGTKFIIYTAMTRVKGSFPVTAQEDIKIESEQAIPGGIVFSCQDNSALLGTKEETNLEFRERILTDPDRQNTIVELETAVRNLPYCFDCRLKFNNTTEPVAVGKYVLPPFTLLVFYSGEIKNEIADIISSYITCPTLETEDSKVVRYYNDVFTSGNMPVYLNPFEKETYTIDVYYKIDETYANDYDAQVTMRTALFNNFVTEQHSDYIKEEDFYTVLNSLNLEGVNILGINLKQEGQQQSYIQVPLQAVPELTEVNFIKV